MTTWIEVGLKITILAVTEILKVVEDKIDDD